MSEWNATCSQAPCNKPRTPEEQLMDYRDELSLTKITPQDNKYWQKTLLDFDARACTPPLFGPEDY